MPDDYTYLVCCRYLDEGVDQYKEVEFREITKAGMFYSLAVKVSMGGNWRELKKRKPLEIDEEVLAQVEEFLNVPDPNPRLSLQSKGASTSI